MSSSVHESGMPDMPWNLSTLWIERAEEQGIAGIETAKAAREHNIAAALMVMELAMQHGEASDVDQTSERIRSLLLTQDVVLSDMLPSRTDEPDEEQMKRTERRIEFERQASVHARAIAEAMGLVEEPGVVDPTGKTATLNAREVWRDHDRFDPTVPYLDEYDGPRAIRPRLIIGEVLRGARNIQAMTGAEDFAHWTQVTDTRQGDKVPSVPFAHNATRHGVVDLGLDYALVTRVTNDRGTSPEAGRIPANSSDTYYTVEVMSTAKPKDNAASESQV